MIPSLLIHTVYGRDTPLTGKVTIPVHHFLDFTITTLPGQTCTDTISSSDNSLALCKDGPTSITGTVDKSGKVDTL